MAEADKKYRFLFIQPFQLSTGGKFADKYHSAELPRAAAEDEYLNIGPLLEDVSGISTAADCSLRRLGGGDPGGVCHVAAARLPIVREACESGKYSPSCCWAAASRVSWSRGRSPASAASGDLVRLFPDAHCLHAGQQFSVIDFTETHNMFYYDLVVRHRMTGRCASIRNINFYHARPGVVDENTIDKEREKALRGEPSEAVERAVREAIAAIEEDGAEVITFGCSDVFWLQSFLQKRLHGIGWEVPVLEGYSSAIVLATLFVDLVVDASGLNYPSERPKRWRRKKIF